MKEEIKVTGVQRTIVYSDITSSKHESDTIGIQFATTADVSQEVVVTTVKDQLEKQFMITLELSYYNVDAHYAEFNVTSTKLAILGK